MRLFLRLKFLVRLFLVRRRSAPPHRQVEAGCQNEIRSGWGSGRGGMGVPTKKKSRCSLLTPLALQTISWDLELL